jgi:hypothetical protein
VLALLASPGCVRPIPIASPAPRATVTPALAQGAPVFAGKPPAHLVVEGRPLDVDPDGNARWLVRAHFLDAQGAPTELLSGGDVAFVPSRGSAQWQTRLRFGGPAAIVSVDRDGPLGARVSAAVGAHVPPVSLVTDTTTWPVPRLVARALGPHEVALGWFPRIDGAPVRIVRSEGSSQVGTSVAAPCSGFRDTTVTPGTSYRYEIALPGRDPVALDVATPREPDSGSLEAFAGKGMWLSFSPSTLDGDGYDKLDPAAMLAQARAAGLHSIVLRTTYGPFEEIAPAAKATIDALIDGATARRIAMIAWTVPRSTSFEDIAAEVDAASYKTPAGNGFDALAVDLERGEYFLGSGSSGYAALASYMRELRAALGPNYPLVATVEDPNLEHLSRAAYPYDAIAASADALQPMIYWRMASTAATPQSVRAAVHASYDATLREAGRRLPIVAGLQSGDYPPRGAPQPDEIVASVRAARESGAFGVTFFDWSATPPSAWKALAQTSW